MTLLGDAFVRIRPDTTGFESETKRSVLGPIKGVAAAAAGALAAVKIGGVLKDSISQASDLNETINKANVIFGQNAKEILAWSKTSAKAFGLSQSASLDAAAGLGNMLQQLGYTGKAAVDVSKSTVKLAADLGSFNNLETGDVLDRISAAMRGEFDSLQALIPNINAARVEQEAMAATGKKTADSLTAQEKVAATLAIVTKDGAAANDDFAETSDGLANSQKILSAQFDDAKTKLGNVFLPAVAGATTFLADKFGPAFDTVSTAASAAITALKDFKFPDIEIPGLDLSAFDASEYGTAGAKLLDGIKDAITDGDFGPLKTAFSDGIDLALGDAVDAFDGVPYVGRIITSIRTGVDTGNWTGVGAALGDAVVDALRGAGNVAADVFTWVKDQVGKVKWFDLGLEAGKQAPTILAGLALGIVNFDIMSLLGGLADNWFEVIIGIVTLALAPLKVVGALGRILAKVPFIGTFLEWLLLGAKSLADGAFALMGRIFSGFFRGLTDGAPGLLTRFGKVIEDVWTWVYVKGDDLIIWFKGLPTKLGNALEEGAEGLGRWFRGGFASLWDGAQRLVALAVAGMVGYFLGMVEKILGAAETMLGWVPGLGDKLRDAQSKFKEFKEGVNSELGGINNKDVVITAVTRGASNLGSEAAQNAGSGTNRDRWMGGGVWGKGSGTSDDIPAMLSNGEHVWTAREVRAAGGHAAVTAMRQGVLNKYAQGGAVDAKVSTAGLDAKGIGATARTYIDTQAEAFRKVQQSAMDKAMAALGGSAGTAQGADAILRFIRSTDSLPYVWGGVGPNGYDCSGLVGEVLNRMIGRRSFSRAFTTASIREGMYGLKPGLGGTLSIGVTPGSGHMAGEYGGLPFEAESTKTGIKIGSAASPVGSFARRFHLAEGGPVETWNTMAQKLDVFGDPSDFHTKYDAGGMLEPGLTTAYNATGKPEPVFTADQWEILKGNLAQGTASGGEFTGNLTLDSGEFLGVVSGVVERRTNAIATSIRHGRR